MEKRKNIIIIFLLILVIVISGIIVYMTGIFNNKNNSNLQTNKEEKEETFEKLDLNNEIVVNFIDKVHYVNDYFVGEKYFGYFYKKDNYTVDTTSNTIKLFMSIKTLEKTNWIYTDNYMIELSGNEVENAFRNIFGPDAKFTNESLDGSECAYAGFKYDNVTNTYSQSGPGCGGTLNPMYDTKTISAKKYNDRIEIIEKVAYIAADTDESGNIVSKVYKTDERKNSIGIATEDVIETYYDQLYSYKYTLKYNENDNQYYFYSVEKVNE